MKKTKIFCVMVTLTFSVAGYSQSSIWMSFSGKGHSTNMMFSGNKEEADNFMTYREYPLLQADLGVNIPIGKSPWALDIAASHRSAKQTLSGVLITNDNWDPTITGDEDFKHLIYLRFLGLRFGPSYAIELNRASRIVVGIGLETYAPVGSKTVMEIDDEVYSENNIYRDEHIELGLFYGAYLRPAYQFKLGKNKRSSRWNLGIYGEGNLMFLNGSKSNPKWAAGGGVQLSFDLS